MQQEDLLKIEIENGIATLWLDHQKEKMNVVSPAFLDIFEKVFENLFQDEAVKAMVLISAKKDFIAGADIKAFKADKKGDFQPISRKAHDFLNRLAKSKKPIVAAIHGTAYGLGVELPLACTARIASDDTRTKFALPEVKLGLLPGLGGTQRLPRLIGLQKALDMMLTGKNIFAYRAKKMGLVDAITDKNKLHQAAVMMAQDLLEKPIQRKNKKNLLNKFLENTSLGRSIVFKQARKMAYKNTQGNYPAVPEIINCVEIGLKKGISKGIEAEIEKFEALMLTPESKALRQVFFNMSANKKNPLADLAKPIKKLGILGAGFMGAGIAEVSVQKNVDVFLKDISEETITQAKKNIWKTLKKKLRYKSISKTQAEETMGRVIGQLDYQNFDSTDLVIEAVVEKMEVKKQIISELEKVCNEGVIIASNTSSLSLTEMANHAQKPENLIGMHYFSPVPKMPLLEIVKTEKTADWVISSCYDFGLKQGKTCIVVKDSPGFYVNRILAPYINECLLMIDEGIEISSIDKALKKAGFPVGPITLLDEVGLDVAAHITRSSSEMVANRPGFEINTSTIKMFEAGKFGKKNKNGFYLYDAKGKKKAIDPSVYKFFKGNGKKTLPEKEIQNRALMMMLNEAVMCLEAEIIANPTDGDIGAVFGIGFPPFKAGPFRYLDAMGIDKAVEIMQDLKNKYGEKFTPAKRLLDGKKFYS